jgi:hypothetical protein
MNSSRSIGPHSRIPFYADVFSYVFAAAICAESLFGNVQFAVWQGFAAAGVFLMLRWVARELHKESRRAGRAIQGF